MDTVYEYREYLCNYLDSMDIEQTVVITVDQFLYLILSSNPSNNESLLTITKKVFNGLTGNNLSATIGNFKKLYSVASQFGLNESLNKEIYDLLVIDQIILHNKELLKEAYSESLAIMNEELINNYNIKKSYLINNILNS